MKRLFVAVAAVAFAGFCNAAELVTQAKTITPLAVPAGKDLRAMFVGLKADALQMGLGEGVLIGTVEHQPQTDASTRVSVYWNAIGVTNAAITQALSSPLSSQFRTADKSVPPGTVLNVRGDLDLLAEDFLKLKARLAKETPKDTIKQVNNNNTTTDTARNANELGASGGGGGASAGNAPYSFNSDNDKMKTDMVTSSWQDCQPRIDRGAGVVYQQARRVDTTESGRLMGTGNCEDHGLTAPIVRTYDGPCMPVIDVQNRKVYHQFVETAKLGDKKIDITTCTADFQKADEILTSTAACGYRHDFTAGKSIRQESLYYNDLTGSMVQVRDCGDSATAFAHYTTQNTCTPTIDSINKQAFINVRTAFKDSDGAEQFASDCKPDGKGALAITEEFCAPKYEHDFVNHVSYYRTRAYYVDTQGTKIYISQCGRSSLDSFPHIFETGSCGVRNDDAGKMTYWSKLTQINSATDGIIEIAPCQEMGSPTPYAYVGRVNGTKVTIISNELEKEKSLAQRVPGVDWSSGKNTYAFYQSPWYESVHYVSLTTSKFSKIAPTLPTDVTVLWLGGYLEQYADATLVPWMRQYFRDRVTKRPYMMRYLRGDGSTFEYEDGAHYVAEIGTYSQWPAP